MSSRRPAHWATDTEIADAADAMPSLSDVYEDVASLSDLAGTYTFQPGDPF